MQEKPKKDLFYEQGIRFECQGSGKCCTSHGEFGFVFLTKEDRNRMAKHLNISLSDFQARHCDQTQGVWHLKEDPKKPDCMFLKSKQCSIYEARPSQCRTWPFWPEVMNAKAWKSEVANFCPGIGKGRIWSKAEIEDAMARDLENERKLIAGE